MGRLTLPPQGGVSIDSLALIYTVEKHPVFGPLLDPLWGAGATGEVEIHCSELLILETLVGPLRIGDASLRDDYEQVFASGAIAFDPITADVLRRAAQLRAAADGLRTPDAIHLATAELHGGALFLTNDQRLRGKTSLPLEILSDLVAP